MYISSFFFLSKYVSPTKEKLFDTTLSNIILINFDLKNKINKKLRF